MSPSATESASVGILLKSGCVPLANGVMELNAARSAFSLAFSQVVCDDHTDAVRTAA